MHIKQITISNFRSFRQQPEIHPFSSGTNVVVGRNGSGKSNLFDAVQFVLLSPKFYSLRTEERQSLLHEGSGSAAVNAFVEIVFDNSDNRFSVESSSDEVVLRRTVGHKKDEFFLQRKRAQKQEVMSLLEGAGFSKSNPYFIVQQGKVNALCTMSDGERLNLLKEVAGTTVYDEKKSESLVKMEENLASISKITEILEYIEEKLEELQGEKEELTRYQSMDRERRAVEYTLYDKELQKAREMLDELEHARSEETDKLSKLHEEAREAHDSIRSVETRMKQKANGLRRNKVQLSNLEEKMREKMTLKTKLDLECKELQVTLQSTEENVAKNKEDLASLKLLIGYTEEELTVVANPKYQEARKNLHQLTSHRDEANKKTDNLYAKQNRGKSFRNKKERDTNLKSQIKDLNKELKDKTTTKKKQDKLLEDLKTSVTTEKDKLTQNNSNLQSKTNLSNQILQSISDQKQTRDAMAEQRRDSWRALDELSEKLTESRETLRNTQSLSRKLTPRATGLGLASLKDICARENIRGYHGTVMENLRLKEEAFGTAVEVAAGNALHHVIVDDDNVAAHLMQKLERGRLGRVTFLPLNRLRNDTPRYPDSNDVAPLLEKCIEYDRRLERAMMHVFGRKLLARNVEVASEWSSRVGMDAITPQGDLCSRRGALTGGFVDPNKNKLKVFQNLHQQERDLEELQSQEREMQRKNQGLDQSIAKVLSEVQKLEAKRGNLDRVCQRHEEDMEACQRKMDNAQRKSKEVREEILPLLEKQVESLPAQITRLQDEMGTELSETLTEEERESLDDLKKEIHQLSNEIEEKEGTLEAASLERQRLQSLLADNLLKRQKELEDSIAGGRRTGEDVLSSTKADLERQQRELDQVTRQEEDTESQLQECKRLDTEIRSDLSSAKTELESLKQTDMSHRRALEEVTDGTDRLLNKRSMCISKRETNMRKIQEIGTLPPTSELEAHKSLSISALLRKLESLNKQIKKYSHVNKKAYDQYVNFSEQREGLLTRKQDLDQGADKVKELVESLDRQKDEAINRTFRGVSAHFKDVFQELVPLGSGELIMKTALPGDQVDEEEEQEEDDQEEDNEGEEPTKKKKSKKKSKKSKEKLTSQPYDPENPVALYRGVGVQVRFSPVGENYLMSQLSGGQKALVALALIFAIQRCDPAPFYLFDELDQALDSTYRASVASLIQRQSSSDENPTQFICSTFRPELVKISNRCFGISHQNKVSSIHHLSKKDALHFIANLMHEEEKVGDVTSLATTRDRSAGSLKRGRKEDDEEESVAEESQ